MMLAMLSVGFTRSIWLALCLLAVTLAQAQQVQPVPPLSARVIDTTASLSAVQLSALEARLQAFEASKGSQVVVLLVPGTAPEDIASYANRVANEWKIGRRDTGDGVLLIVAKDERSLRIEVAKTLEGAIPDLAAKRIIEQAITPRFKQGDYAGGIDAGVTRIFALISGEALPAVSPVGSPGQRGQSGFQWMDMLVFMVFALPIAAAIARNVFGRKLGALATGAAVGGLALFFSASIVLAGIAGIIALVFALISGSTTLARGGNWGGGGFGSGGGWGGGG
ncbi:MAG: TPM domain-containing protein, partial [Rhodoferax sp.]|nr:TPM domain-containing protein [Rhodoferax sp.]